MAQLNERTRALTGLYVRNIVFGVEDSLVSTVGLLSGIAIAGATRAEIVLTGIVLIIVESFSMAAGSFLSERSVEEYIDHRRNPNRPSLTAGIVMFLSYLAAGLVPLAPYLATESDAASPLSVGAAIAALALLGAWSARRFNRPLVASSLRMAAVGSVAIAVGIAAGLLLR